MNAIAGVSAEHQALLDEYRTALRLWTEARALYPDLSPAVIAATARLNEVERELRTYGAKPASAGQARPHRQLED